jgi:phage-related protein
LRRYTKTDIIVEPELPARKQCKFVGSSLKDLQSMPEDVKDVFGAAILDAQYGDTPADARPFGEGVSRDVMKLVEDHDGDTYRVAYTIAFERCVYVLHAFQKKSKSGIATPRPDINVVKQRLKLAREHYKKHFKEPPENR